MCKNRTRFAPTVLKQFPMTDFPWILTLSPDYREKSDEGWGRENEAGEDQGSRERELETGAGRPCFMQNTDE